MVYNVESDVAGSICPALVGGRGQRDVQAGLRKAAQGVGQGLAGLPIVPISAQHKHHPPFEGDLPLVQRGPGRRPGASHYARGGISLSTSQ
jgi:hypothetical protein